MPRIEVICGDASVIKALMNMAMALQAGRSDDGPDSITMNVELGAIEEKKPHVVPPRMAYKYVGPMTDKAIKDALEAVGEGTIQGVVFMDVVDATRRANEAGDESLLATEPGIRVARKFKTKSVQRSLVDLRAAKLVISQPIVNK